MKNPFKKESIADTLINLIGGGAANVAIDYAFAQVDALASLGETTKNVIKIGAGVLGGTMVKNKYLRAATNGMATVGVSNLIDSYINGSAASASDAATSTSGAPFIGRIRKTGNRSFKKAIHGAAGVPFMS